MVITKYRNNGALLNNDVVTFNQADSGTVEGNCSIIGRAHLLFRDNWTRTDGARACPGGQCFGLLKLDR